MSNDHELGNLQKDISDLKRIMKEKAEEFWTLMQPQMRCCISRNLQSRCCGYCSEG